MSFSTTHVSYPLRATPVRLPITLKLTRCNLRRVEEKEKTLMPIGSVSYGEALVLAEFLEVEDIEGLKLIHETIGFPQTVISTLQLALIALKVLPGGSWKRDPLQPDFTPAAQADFKEHWTVLASIYAPLFTPKDPLHFESAVHSVVETAITPLFNQDGPGLVEMRDVGLDEEQLVGVCAVVSLACVKTVEEYSLTVDGVEKEGAGVQFLRELIPRFGEE